MCLGEALCVCVVLGVHGVCVLILGSTVSCFFFGWRGVCVWFLGSALYHIPRPAHIPPIMTHTTTTKRHW